jgi:hypothetical protein
MSKILWLSDNDIDYNESLGLGIQFKSAELPANNWKQYMLESLEPAT